MDRYFINIVFSYKHHNYYNFCFKDLFLRHSIKTIIFHKKSLKNIDFKKISKYLEFRKYFDFEDLKKQVKEIWKQNIFYINTFDEKLVLEKNILQKELWIETTDKFEIFRNKDLQRKYLLEKYPETTVNYQEIYLEKDEKIIMQFPCIIKPTSWVQSSWVTFLKSFEDFLAYKKNLKNLKKNLEARWYENEKFILEEFIDWEMYTINYFVDSNWKAFYTPIVKVNGIRDLWINDFSNYVRISEEYFENEINKKEVYDFVEKHIKTFGIKNTFVHHEFKLNSAWILKTIELNWRIWGYRLELNREVYSFNMFDLIFWEKVNFKTDFYYAAFVFYSEKEWILKWFNKNLEEKFKSMKSFLSLNKMSSKLWKMTWLAKNWYSSVASMKIKNCDKETFKKDFDFIIENYKNFLEIK